HVSADVDVHGRHADDAGRDKSAFADRRTPGHDANPIGNLYAARREGVFIDKRKDAAFIECLERPDAKTQQDAALDPLVRAPCPALLRRGADRTLRQGLAELQEDFSRVRGLQRICARGSEFFDLLLQLTHGKRKYTLALRRTWAANNALSRKP